MHAAVDGKGFGHMDAHGLEAAVDVVKGEAEEACDAAVVYAGGDGFSPGVVAYGFPAADHVVSFFEFLDEPWDFFGVVLEVSIHGDDDFAAGLGKTGREGGGFAGAVWQVNGLDGLDTCG